MGGFKNNNLNVDFENGILDNIVARLVKCSDDMRAVCITESILLFRHEDKITNRLHEYHLNDKQQVLRFSIQSQESYDPLTDCYKGRADIKVVSCNYFLNEKDYYLIECKLIDGRSDLNRKYVDEGVARFVGSHPKYPSPNSKNIMFGYITENIDVEQNTAKIGGLQTRRLLGVVSGKFVKKESYGTHDHSYSCDYKSNDAEIELRHLFYDFSDVIRN